MCQALHICEWSRSCRQRNCCKSECQAHLSHLMQHVLSGSKSHLNSEESQYTEETEWKDLTTENKQLTTIGEPADIDASRARHCCQNPCDCAIPESTFITPHEHSFRGIRSPRCSLTRAVSPLSRDKVSHASALCWARPQESSTRCIWTHCFQGHIYSGNSLRPFCAQPDNTDLSDLEHDKPAWFKRTSAAPLRDPCSLPFITSHHRNIIMEGTPSPPS